MLEGASGCSFCLILLLLYQRNYKERSFVLIFPVSLSWSSSSCSVSLSSSGCRLIIPGRCDCSLGFMETFGWKRVLALERPRMYQGVFRFGSLAFFFFLLQNALEKEVMKSLWGSCLGVCWHVVCAHTAAHICSSYPCGRDKSQDWTWLCSWFSVIHKWSINMSRMCI